MRKSIQSNLSMATCMIEYAKSGRSGCKHCGLKIDRDSVRVGLTSKGAGGFELTRWHHVPCYFQLASKSVEPVEKWEGYKQIKSADRALLLQLQRDDDESKDGTDGVLKRRKIEPVVVTNKYDEAAWKQTLANFTVESLSATIMGANLPVGWKGFGKVIVSEPQSMIGSEKIAAFDFDGCLAHTDVRRLGAHEWRLQYETVPDRMAELHQEGFKLVIFSNEANIERFVKARQLAVDSKLGRLAAFQATVGLPIQIFVSCASNASDDACRKPGPGMWDLLEAHFNGGVKILKQQSFFVGDAAGRAGDHSSTDKDFAEKVGIRFYTPEEMFEVGSTAGQAISQA